ncbi:FtsX-like permease family protein [Oceanivirga salmonicida]|uniref:FtsX-like permease family protein n=4 Tax=Oceanivirga salmonicida TaxID=1769291 RepID=UPI0012E200F5|nr:FtsX-like permease family protein [Oceanivirga salmonicida]
MKVSDKDSLKEILKSKSRFFSILIIILLSSLVFVGLNTTVFDVKNNINEVLIKNNVYDIRIESIIGFNDEDKKLIENLENVESIEYYNETITDTNDLYIENEKLNKDEKLELKNTTDSNYFDLSYLSKSVYKNGVKINKLYFVPKSTIRNDIKDNVALIYLKKDKKINIFSKKHLLFSRNIKEKIRKIFENRPDEVRKSIIDDIDEGLLELKDGKNKLTENYNELKKSENTIKKEENKLYNARLDFKKYRLEIEKNKKVIDSKRDDLLENYKKINNGLSELEEKIPEVLVGLGKIKEEEEKLEARKDSIFLSNSKYLEYKSKIDENKIKLQKVLQTRDELLKNKKKIEEGLSSLEKANEEIITNENKLKFEIQKYNNEFAGNVNKLNKSKSKIKNGYSQIRKSRKEISTKEKELNKIKENLIKPSYNIATIYDNANFLNIYNNIESMNAISLIFSSLFFLITLFIITTTIIRFSFEQRNIIGTYKFLGYSNKIVIKKFLLYALIPAIIGIIFGSVIGVLLLPKLLIPSFFTNTIDIFTKFNLYIDYKIILINAFVLIAVIILTVILILRKLLNKKVITLLNSNDEKISVVKFKSIILRNLIKYKLRLFMTLFGISLCTSLIYLGIAIRYSIKDIVDIQYSKIQKVDATVYLKPNVSNEEIEKYINKISNDAEVLKQNSSIVKIEKNNREYNIEKIEIIDNNYKDFYTFELEENETIISNKTAKILEISENDNIGYLDRYNQNENIKIDKIFENYISQYIYTKNKDSIVNSLAIKFKNEKIDLNDDIVYTVSYTADNKEIFNNQIKSLNAVVVFMIVLGASLAITVTYNLGNINIIERRREIATLEVIGYTNRELNRYIFREILILAILSITVGIFLGRYLHIIVADQFKTSVIELVLYFNYNVILYSALLPFMFVILVLVVLTKQIRDINMIESLKISE